MTKQHHCQRGLQEGPRDVPVGEVREGVTHMEPVAQFTVVLTLKGIGLRKEAISGLDDKESRAPRVNRSSPPSPPIELIRNQRHSKQGRSWIQIHWLYRTSDGVRVKELNIPREKPVRSKEPNNVQLQEFTGTTSGGKLRGQQDWIKRQWPSAPYSKADPNLSQRQVVMPISKHPSIIDRRPRSLSVNAARRGLSKTERARDQGAFAYRASSVASRASSFTASPENWRLLARQPEYLADRDAQATKDDVLFKDDVLLLRLENVFVCPIVLYAPGRACCNRDALRNRPVMGWHTTRSVARSAEEQIQTLTAAGYEMRANIDANMVLAPGRETGCILARN
ncbi:hypothetical protein C8Q76DRAFT_693653 [Earliella scabrosa]|nr:hypothetical protein C8Q76DRAFT_693653 [Earliella scabrosa]